MSKSQEVRRNSPAKIAQFKGVKPIVALTSYQAYSAAIADQYCDLLLVGDSLGMVVYGMDSTLGVSLDMMINHAKAVVNSTKQALIIVDMPFGTYESDQQTAFNNSARLMAQTGCGGVKLEGGVAMAETVKFLVKRGIPVLGHIGLTPQSFNVLGGYKVQGREKAAQQAIIEDAKALEEAGAFGVVVEGVVEPLAKEITQQLKIPVIGIGASKHCDGQILVSEDMLGCFDKTAKFVRQFGHLNQAMHEAFSQYRQSIYDGSFPDDNEIYK